MAGLPAGAWILLLFAVGLGLALELTAYVRARRRGSGDARREHDDTQRDSGEPQRDYGGAP